MNGQKNPKSHERTNPLTKCAHFPTVICCVMPPSEHGRGRAVGGTISQLASKTNAESRPDNAAVINSYIEFVKQDPLPIRFPKEHKRLRVGQTAFDREVLDCIDELLHLGQYMIKQQSCAMIDDDMGRK